MANSHKSGVRAPSQKLRRGARRQIHPARARLRNFTSSEGWYTGAAGCFWLGKATPPPPPPPAARRKTRSRVCPPGGRSIFLHLITRLANSLCAYFWLHHALCVGTIHGKNHREAKSGILLLFAKNDSPKIENWEKGEIYWVLLQNSHGFTTIRLILIDEYFFECFILHIILI